MSIPRETIELIRDRAQIEEIIKRYVPSLKKRGNNYIALCPFHKEKTPSFSVSPDKQIFHCFGCHTGGNVFSFISKIESLNFPESVRFVGDIVGIRVEEKTNDKKNEEYSKLKHINRLAMDLYHNTMRIEAGKEGLNYLLKRGITKESIVEFKLGYSPDSWNYLVNHLKSSNISLELASKVGVLSVSDKRGDKHFYDRFRKRVIFPIFDRRNEVVAFGGRIVGDGEPKYLNSTESIVYQKRNELYGFNIAKDYISELGRAIVVEGYLDVIGCHQAGIKNVVAPLGTALTSNQVKLLARFCKEVILLFDADSAGIKAALRSIEIFKDINVDVKIAVLPEGDPFDFISDRGLREFMVIVDQALSPVDYRISRVFANTERKDSIKVLLDIFDIIKDIEYETKKNEYIKKISSMLKIDENSVRADFKKFLLKGKNVDPVPADRNHDKEKSDFLTRSYQEMVILLCNHPDLLEQAMMDFTESEFPDNISRNIFKRLSDTYSTDEEISAEKIFDIFPEGEEKIFLEQNLFRENNIEATESASSEYYTKRYVRIKIEHIDQKISRYTEMIKKMSSDNNHDSNSYLSEIDILHREKDRLLSYFSNPVL